MKVVDSNGYVVEINKGDIPFKQTSIKDKADMMFDFLEKTSKTIKADKSQCIVGIQPFDSTDVLFILQKMLITDDTVLKNANNPSYKPASDYEASMLKSIFAIERKGKPEYCYLYLQPIEFERNLYDGEYISVTPKQFIPYDVFSKRLSNKHEFMLDDEYANYKEIAKDNTKPFLKSGYRFYNIAHLDLTNPDELLDKALLFEKKDGVYDYDKIYLDVYNYCYQEGIESKDYLSNDATKALYAINENNKKNIYGIYNAIKKELQNGFGENVSNIHYEGSVVCFSTKVEPNGKIYICNRDTVDDKPLLIYNGTMIHGVENIRQWLEFCGKDGQVYKPAWFLDKVEPNIDEATKDNTKGWGKFRNSSKGR